MVGCIKDEKECNCECHRTLGMVHVMACCDKAPVCMHYNRTWWRKGTLEKPIEMWICNSCGKRGSYVTSPDGDE